MSCAKLYDDIMYKTNLRKVGGSVMLAVPPAILELLGLSPGETVGIVVDGGRLIVERQSKPRYTLDQLLAECDPDAARPEDDDRAWLDVSPVGLEE